MKLCLSVLLLDKGGLLCVELAELLFCIWRPLISSKDKSISGALCGALHINISPCVSLLISSCGAALPPIASLYLQY